MSFTLTPSQQEAHDFIVSTPKCILSSSMSFGKTLTISAAINTLRPDGHILIIAPKTIARTTWAEEFSKFDFPFRYKSLIFDEKDKQFTKAQRYANYQALFTDEPTIYTINKEMVVDLVLWLIENHPHPQDSAYPMWPFPTVIVDEIQGFKSAGSKRFQALAAVASQTTRFIGATGTPIPNGTVDIWALSYLLDQGATLGKTIKEFEATFCEPENPHNPHTKMVPVKKINPMTGQIIFDASAVIAQLVAPLMRSFAMDGVALPPFSIVDIPVILTDDELKLYRKLRNDFMLEIGCEDGDIATMEASNAAVLRSRLMQYASGSYYETDPETGTSTLRVIHRAKLDTLIQLLRGIKKTVVLAYYYNSDRDLLLEHLSKEFRVAIFDGSVSMKQAYNEGAYDVLMLHPASAGHGHNLQFGSHILIWYTLPDAMEYYAQANYRLIRKGQEHHVQIYRLLTQGTVDEDQPERLDRKMQEQDDFLEVISA